MITLIGSLLGFISSTFPSILRLWQDASDKKHELAILQMQMQMQFQAQGHQERIEEINAQADIAESAALYKTYSTGINWVDALNGTVRPVIAYAFFVLYATVKILAYHTAAVSGTTPFFILHGTLWTGDDAAIFAGIISFYFGQRAMSKLHSIK
jgi:hypothetical protein